MKDNWYPKVLLSDDKNPNRLVLGQIGTCQWNLLEENLHLPQELLLCYWWQMGYWVPSRPNLHSDYFQSVTRLCNLSLGECYPKLSCTCNSHQISHSGKLTKHPLTPNSNLQLEWNTGFSWRHTRGSLRSPWSEYNLYTVDLIGFHPVGFHN